jgi:glycerol-3-phosphate acyltransferase PlsX
MGGDFAPKNEIEGALLAQSANVSANNKSVEIVLFGVEDTIRKVAADNKLDISAFQIVDSPDIIDMHDDPTEILKTKKNSSLHKGLTAVSKGELDGFVSSGNTGATMTTSTIILGRIKGVSRPSIAAFFPTINPRPTLLLDVGATVDHKSRFLYEYAIMGSIYYKTVYNIENPTVALLNVGEEDSKGTDVLRETYGMLKESNLNFVGNMEGRDILAGSADVIVCDGYVGNVILKFAESFKNILKTKIKDFASKSITNKVKGAMALPALKGVFKDFDYQEYGGVPVLGVNGISIVGHGKSSPLAVKNMILRAKELVESELVSKIEQSISININKSN